MQKRKWQGSIFFAHPSSCTCLNIVRPLCCPCCARPLNLCVQTTSLLILRSPQQHSCQQVQIDPRSALMTHAILKQSSSNKLALTSFQGCSVRAEPFTHKQAPWAIRQKRPKHAEEKVAGFHILCSPKPKHLP